MNIIFTLLGWIAWNWFEFTNQKDVFDEQDKKFPYRSYAGKKWENWVWTLIVAAILYLIGWRGLGMELVQSFDEKLQWNDLYYFASGLVSEAISYAYRRWVKKQTLADK